jgi:hypothetical protein
MDPDRRTGEGRERAGFRSLHRAPKTRARTRNGLRGHERGV